MKVIVYNISQEDKENLARINRKKHKITAIKDSLTELNVDFAHHKDAVIVINRDYCVSAILIQKLQLIGIKLIISWSLQDLIVDGSMSNDSDFEYITIKTTDSKAAATRTIDVLDHWEKK